MARTKRTSKTLNGGIRKTNTVTNGTKRTNSTSIGTKSQRTTRTQKSNGESYTTITTRNADGSYTKKRTNTYKNPKPVKYKAPKASKKSSGGAGGGLIVILLIGIALVASLFQ